MIFLYPNMMFEKTVDPEFLEEMIEAENMGNVVCTTKDARVKSVHPQKTLFRGWMKTEDEYTKMYGNLSSNGFMLINTPEQYCNTHYIHKWYSALYNTTFKTWFFDSEEYALSFIEKSGKMYVVKDAVKFGGIAATVDELKSVFASMKKYRGEIEGCISLREYHELDQYSEKRFFVFNGKVFSNGDPIPYLVHDIVGLVDSNFYSVDVITDVYGKEWIVEIGDGQVSGLKKWNVNTFYEIFKNG